MTEFSFKTGSTKKAFCNYILDEMVDLFKIPRSEALGRMNRSWKGLELIGDEDMIYHEDEEFWAKSFYYGMDVNWWLNPPDLNPLPFP